MCTYSSGLTDVQWVLVEPVITAGKARHPSVSGHQGKYAMREIVNATLYQNRTGCRWEFPPHGLSVGVPAPRHAPARSGEVLLPPLARRRHRPGHPRPAASADAG
ncbi:transposase [Streptomyces cavernae]|uniref:transposase n=1 Tax=Streptomyces cavernae TaxID=2259034 RepID=UPI001EE48B12|nr:transposase [Streptomyces cavernae]